MAGGLLNLIEEGETENIMLNGNPSTTFFKKKYAKYTNFGLQKFVIDYEGSKTIRISDESVFNFKIPNYGDLLMDSFLSLTLPHIWSPILPPKSPTLLNEIYGTDGHFTEYSNWVPYEFKWIKHIGSHIIKKIKISCGNQTIQEYSGEYILNMVNRDFTHEKKNLFNKMIGHTSDMYDPKKYNNNNYPNAYSGNTKDVIEPSIYGRILMIPMNSFFMMNSEMAFPLLSLNNSQLNIEITLRPINELYIIRDVYDDNNKNPYVSPSPDKDYMDFYRFIHPPENVSLDKNTYSDTRSQWDTQIKLICTQCYLSQSERDLFLKNEQKYLIKQIRETTKYDLVNKIKTEIESDGQISNFMFYFQRSDINKRNQWSNYTNWSDDFVPNSIVKSNNEGDFFPLDVYSSGFGPGKNPNGSDNNIYISKTFSGENVKEILFNSAIVMNGEYRENDLTAATYDIDKYSRISGSGVDGVYCYNFGLNTSNVQPSGSFNTHKLKLLEFEFELLEPPINPEAIVYQICDPETNEIIGIDKQSKFRYMFTYTLTMFEERYNILHFKSGLCKLIY
jgi:hypothetical protein